MIRPPAVIVHGLAQAQSALAIGAPVTLLSAPGAALYAGALWWREMIAAASGSGPGLIAADILDCGDAPGRALQALRVGQRILVLRAPAEVRVDIAERAARQGATVLAEPPLALDLAVRGAERRLKGWLVGDRQGRMP